MKNITSPDSRRKRLLLLLLFAGLSWCSAILILLNLHPRWPGSSGPLGPLLPILFGCFIFAMIFIVLPVGVIVSAGEIYRMRRWRRLVPVKRLDFLLSLITLVTALSAFFTFFLLIFA